jgi:hypothetical protein
MVGVDAQPAKSVPATTGSSAGLKPKQQRHATGGISFLNVERPGAD